MSLLAGAAFEFLEQPSIAIAGVSRKGDLPANYIYRTLRDRGHTVYAINPNTDTVEGDRCYRRLGDIPGPVDGLVIAAHPTISKQLAVEAAALGIPRVWLHRSFGDGSVSDEAVEVC